MRRLALGLMAGLAGLWGCRLNAVAPSGSASAKGPAAAATTTPAAAGAASGTAGAASAPAAPRLLLRLGEMKERTGGEFGLLVPMLLVTISYEGSEAVEVPQLGVDMIVSLRLSITPAAFSAGSGHTMLRHATLLRPWTVQLAPLAAGTSLTQGLSPLSVERRDVPLALGRYRVSACVPPSGEATYPSPFTDRFGGVCSNEIEIEVKRRR